MKSMIDMNTDYLLRISQLCLFDDDFMNIVFQNDKCIKLLLDIILDSDIRITDMDIQYPLDNIKGRTIIIDMYYEELREEVRYYKESKEGIVIGEYQNRIISIQSLMKNLNLSIEEAMEALSIPTYEYE